MSSLSVLHSENNRKVKINFAGGDLSSDSGLLLIKEFAYKLGFHKLIKNLFKTNDTAKRTNKDDENLCQVIYQILAGYFNDNNTDELANEPVFKNILENTGGYLPKEGTPGETGIVPHEGMGYGVLKYLTPQGRKKTFLSGYNQKFSLIIWCNLIKIFQPMYLKFHPIPQGNPSVL